MRALRWCRWAWGGENVGWQVDGRAHRKHLWSIVKTCDLLVGCDTGPTGCDEDKDVPLGGMCGLLQQDNVKAI